ncbi:MAG: four helix bundle protein [Candidatus Omnitrophota bacterium]
MENKKIKSVEDFVVYQKAIKLFDDFIEKDLPLLRRNFAGESLAKNQLRCLDSICANMEEGYDRKSGKEVINFFRISKGSTAEARGRYTRFKNILSKEVINQRVQVLSEIRAMLESLIAKWK